MSENGTLVLGAGHAGVHVASTLRELGYRAPVRLVDAQEHLPYHRPPLSKNYLTDDSTPDALAFKNPDFYPSHDIDLALGVQIVRISEKQAVTSDGSVFEFDDLVLATGARARKMAVPGADLDGVCYLRTLDDAHWFRDRLPTASRVVVVGGGYIGLEAAALASKLGKRVTLVERDRRLLSRSATPVLADLFLQAHRKRGVDVMLESVVTEFRGQERVETVMLASGIEIEADLVVVGIGITTDSTWVEQLELEHRGGRILVDEWGRTSASGVYAAGDCAAQLHPLYPDLGPLFLESVQQATDQAKTVACAIAGQPLPPPAVPWFWSDQGDLKFKSAGMSAGYDEAIVRGRPSDDSFSVLYLRSGALVACDSVNRAADYAAARSLLRQETLIDVERAKDAEQRLRDAVIATKAPT